MFMLKLGLLANRTLEKLNMSNTKMTCEGNYVTSIKQVWSTKQICFFFFCVCGCVHNCYFSFFLI